MALQAVTVTSKVGVRVALQAATVTSEVGDDN